MLHRKDYGVVDIVFPFIASFLDHAIGCGSNPPLKRVHASYSDNINQPQCTKPERERQRIQKVATIENIRRLQLLVENGLEELEDSNLLMIRVDMIDHIVEDWSRFGAFNF